MFCYRAEPGHWDVDAGRDPCTHVYHNFAAVLAAAGHAMYFYTNTNNAAIMPKLPRLESAFKSSMCIFMPLTVIRIN